MTVYICIPFGKTTSNNQFERLVDSLRLSTNLSIESSNTKFELFVYSDRETEVVEKKLYELNSHVICHVFKRDDDPGEIRNEFLALMSSEYYKSEDSVFTFIDGDDFVSIDYFNELPKKIDEIQERGWAICDPVAWYSEKETDSYRMKWCLRSMDGIVNQTIKDNIGCQCWGRFYDIKLSRELKFGRGLFEDVEFTYRLVQKYPNPVTMPSSVYYWRRNNQNAMTRNTCTKTQILDGINNLIFAWNFSEKHWPEFKEERVKRTTTGTLTLLRNSAQTGEESYSELKKMILDKLGNHCDFKSVKVSEPKLWERLSKVIPDLDNLE